MFVLIRSPFQGVQLQVTLTARFASSSDTLVSSFHKLFPRDQVRVSVFDMVKNGQRRGSGEEISQLIREVKGLMAFKVVRRARLALYVARAVRHLPMSHRHTICMHIRAVVFALSPHRSSSKVAQAMSFIQITTGAPSTDMFPEPTKLVEFQPQQHRAFDQGVVAAKGYELLMSKSHDDKMHSCCTSLTIPQGI